MRRDSSGFDFFPTEKSSLGLWFILAKWLDTKTCSKVMMLF